MAADRADRRHHLGSGGEPDANGVHELPCRDRAAVRRALGVERVAELVEVQLAPFEPRPCTVFGVGEDNLAEEPVGEAVIPLVRPEHVERRWEDDPSQIEDHSRVAH